MVYVLILCDPSFLPDINYIIIRNITFHYHPLNFLHLAVYLELTALPSVSTAVGEQR